MSLLHVPVLMLDSIAQMFYSFYMEPKRFQEAAEKILEHKSKTVKQPLANAAPEMCSTS